MNTLKVTDIVTKFLNKKRSRKKLKLKEISTKAKVKKKKSKKTEILDKIFQKKTDDQPSIDQVILENDLKLDDETKKYFYALNKLRSDYNKRLSLPANLITGDITYYINISLETNVINNDKLTNCFLLYNNIGEYENIKKLIGSSRLSNVSIASTDMILFSEKDLYTKEFYVEDFTKFYSFITTDDPRGSFNEYFKKGITMDFKIEGQKYEGRGSDNFIMTYLLGTDEKKLKLIFDSAQYLTREKGQFKVGLKPIKKGSGLFYFQQTFPITDFCPGYCLLDKKYTFGALYKAKINPEDLFNMLYNFSMKNPNDPLPLNDDFLNVSNIDSLMIIVNLLSYIVGNDEIKKVCVSYEKCKENIFYIKQDYQLFRQACLSFYDNFSVKLNLDRLASVYVLCNNYLTKAITYSRYYTDPDLTPLLTFIQKYGSTFYNFLTLGRTNVITQIRDVCDNILNAKLQNIDDLENGARNVGMTIYNLTMSDTSNNKACLYDIRSPFGFLTNLVGNSSGIVSNVTFDYKEIFEDKMKNLMNIDDSPVDQMQQELNDEPQKVSSDALKNSLYTSLQQIIETPFNIDSVNIVNNLINEYNTAEGETVVMPVNTQPMDDSCNLIYTNLTDALGKANQGNVVSEFNQNKNYVISVLKTTLVLKEYLTILAQLGNSIQNQGINADVYNHYSLVIFNDLLKPQNKNYQNLVNYIQAAIANNKLVMYTYLTNNFPYNN